MSRDPYSSGSGVVGGPGGGGTRSPRSGRRVGELPTVDRSPSRSYASGRGSPLGRKRGTRSGNNSPEHLGYSSYHHHQLSSPYYSREEDLASPVMLEERGRSMSTGGGGGGHHRSRSASRPAMSSSAGMSTRYTSLDRASAGILDHDREFVPIRDPRERSRDRGLYLEDELYSSRSARQSPNPHMLRDGGGYIGELQHQNNDLQRELGNLKKELELTNQKLGSSMHSIKTFWSPELKKERALRKEESTKYSLINEQLKLLNNENQVSGTFPFFPPICLLSTPGRHGVSPFRRFAVLSTLCPCSASSSRPALQFPSRSRVQSRSKRLGRILLSGFSASGSVKIVRGASYRCR